MPGRRGLRTGPTRGPRRRLRTQIYNSAPDTRTLRAPLITRYEPRTVVQVLDEQNSLPLTVSPFVQSDWPIPRGPSWFDETWGPQNLLLTTLVEAPVVDSPFVPQDLPTPRGSSWFDETWVQNLQQTTLAPVVVVDPPFIPYDLPIPRGLSWFDETWGAQSLLLTTLAVPFIPHDLPAPRGQSWFDETWLQNLQQTTLAPVVVVAPPFIPRDLPNPRGPGWFDKTWGPQNLLPTFAVPFVPHDLPTPRGLSWFDETWSQNLQQTTLAPAVAVAPPFVPHDLPTPRGQSWFDETWVQNLQQTTLAPVVAVASPFIPSAWPNPRPVSWQIVEPERNRLPINTKPFGQDWPNPSARYIQQPVQQQSLLGLLGTLAVPFAQLDWPNPTIVQQARFSSWATPQIQASGFTDLQGSASGQSSASGTLDPGTTGRSQRHRRHADTGGPGWASPGSNPPDIRTDTDTRRFVPPVVSDTKRQAKKPQLESNFTRRVEAKPPRVEPKVTIKRPGATVAQPTRDATVAQPSATVQTAMAAALEKAGLTVFADDDEVIEILQMIAPYL